MSRRTRPATLPIQPEPIGTLVSHYWTADGECISALSRLWQDGDTRRCLLCDECSATHSLNFCQLQVRQYVPLESGSLFCSRGLVFADFEDGARLHTVG
jgi:hypothetical protein